MPTKDTVKPVRVWVSKIVYSTKSYPRRVVLYRGGDLLEVNNYSTFIEVLPPDGKPFLTLGHHGLSATDVGFNFQAWEGPLGLGGKIRNIPEVRSRFGKVDDILRRLREGRGES